MHKWPFAMHPATVPSPIPFHVCMLFLHAPNPHVSTTLTLSQPTSNYPSRNAPVTSLWSSPIHLLIAAGYVRASFCTSSTPQTGRTRLRSPSKSPIVQSTICSIRLCPKDQLMTCHSQHADTRGVTAFCHHLHPDFMPPCLSQPLLVTYAVSQADNSLHPAAGCLL